MIKDILKHDLCVFLEEALSSGLVGMRAKVQGLNGTTNSICPTYEDKKPKSVQIFTNLQTTISFTHCGHW